MFTDKRFGDFAVELGYCTPEDTDRAAEIQQDLVARGHPHMLIGLVMVRYGVISNAQLIEILKVLEQQQVESIIAG
jgi:hypothetical protein